MYSLRGKYNFVIPETKSGNERKIRYMMTFNRELNNKTTRTWGNFSNIPAVCINSHPKILKSVSVSESNPSNFDGVGFNFSSGKRQLVKDKTIFPYGFGGSLLFVTWLLSGFWEPID